MHDAMIEEPECTRTDDFDNCGYPVGAVLYFVTYIIAMGYIFTNLFVAAILDHVTFGTVKETALIGPTHLWDFQALWTHFDPRAEGYVVREVLHPRWGFHRSTDRTSYYFISFVPACICVFFLASPPPVQGSPPKFLRFTHIKWILFGRWSPLTEASPADAPRWLKNKKTKPTFSCC